MTNRSSSKCQLYGFHIQSWYPAFSDQTLLGDVKIEKVQGVVNCLDFANLHEPVLDVLRRRHQHAVTVVLGLA